MPNSQNNTLEQVKTKYEEIFGQITPETQTRIFRSPGRINLIGEHTDYNNGFVLPASVDKAVYFVISPREDDQVVLHATDLGETYRFPLSDLSKPKQEWAFYQLSVIEQLQKNGHSIKGFQAAFGGDIPVGAGLSSSAALECCLAFGLNEMNGLGLDRYSIVKLAQKAENEYVGVQCGIMDQFASAFGKKESVIRLDCRSLEFEYFPFAMSEYQIVLCDTKVKHSLADSEYNTRRLECEEGVSMLQKHDPSIKSLRDTNSAFVETHQSEMSEVVYRRCKYITDEIQRVIDGCKDLSNGDLGSFGKKMYETHFGLQNEYEVSCPELDFLVAETLENDAVLGARMMGGGFGGCTINLVKVSEVENFESAMKKSYLAKYNIDLPCYRVTITDGTNEVV